MKKLLPLLALAAFAGAAAAADKFKSGVFEPPRAAPEIALHGSDGKDLKLSQYRGKVVALGFGFSHCPEICPTTLDRLAKARKRLGPAGSDLQVVYVTVDPERDSPERLRTYLAAFDPGFIGATGSSAQVDKVQKEYGIVAAKKLGKDPRTYGVDHSSFVYLVDRGGHLRVMVPYGKSADDIAHDVALLLKK